MKRALFVATALLVPIAVACGDDDDDDGAVVPAAASVPGTVPSAAETASPASVGPTSGDTRQIVEVVATDYRFDGLPASVPAGTQFALQNDSTKEVHEMIMIRIPDEETRTVGQISALTPEEQDAIFADVEPTTVIVALPGEAGQPVMGEGVLDEPGRYAVVCFIPVGADPELIRESMENPDPDDTEAPDMGDGPPHFMEGMYAEVLVEEA